MKRRIIVVLCVTLVVMLLPLSGCTPTETARVKEYISEYADEKIIISGLTDEEFTVTPGELVKLELASRTATGQYEKAGTVNATGPTLDTFLAQYGKKQTDFKLIRFFASDGYRITLLNASLIKYEVVMAIANSDGPLSESRRPLRLLIAGMESSKWIYALERIEFVHLEE